MMPILTLNNMMAYNDTLFDQIVLPDPGMDRDILVDVIMDHFGEMQVVIPDWSMLRHSVNMWFSAHSIQLMRLWDAYVATYDPVYNKDYYEEEERTPDLTRTTVESKTTQRSTTGQQTSTTDRSTTTAGTETGSTSGSSNGSTTENPGQILTESGSETSQYKGFNSSGFNDVTKTLPGKVQTASGTNTANGSSSTTGTSSRKTNETEHTGGTDSTGSTSSTGGTDTGETTETSSGTEKITRHMYGNIGVTMASDIIRDSAKLWRAFNWYDVTAELWASDNLVMVY